MYAVKMAGYWPSSFFVFLWIKTKSKSIKKNGMSAFLLHGTFQSEKNICRMQTLLSRAFLS